MEGKWRVKIKNLSSLCDCDVLGVVKIMLREYKKGKKEITLSFMKVKVLIKEQPGNVLEIEIKDL